MKSSEVERFFGKISKLKSIKNLNLNFSSGNNSIKDRELAALSGSISQLSNIENLNLDFNNG